MCWSKAGEVSGIVISTAEIVATPSQQQRAAMEKVWSDLAVGNCIRSGVCGDYA